MDLQPRPSSSKPRAFTWSAGAILSTVVLNACGGGSTVPGAAPIYTLSSAVATGCVYPTTVAQSVALPTAGGVTGTIGIGAVSTSSGTCSAVKVATGADTVSTNARARRAASKALAETSPTLPPPEIQISLTDTYTGNLEWAFIKLQLKPDTLAPGQYPAAIVSTVDLGDGQTSTSFKTFTVTIGADGSAVITGPNAGKFLAVLAADTTGTLNIYKPGTVLPTPEPLPISTPTETPTPSSTATPTPTPSATPSPAPSTTPTAPPIASPAPSPTSSYPSLSITPNTCVDAGSNGDTIAYTAEVTGGAPLPSGATYQFGWQSGSAEEAFGLTVPPPTTQYAGTNILVGPSDTATVTVPAFGQFGLTGVEGYTTVYLFIAQYGGLGYAENQYGRISASDVIAAGQITCASIGL